MYGVLLRKKAQGRQKKRDEKERALRCRTIPSRRLQISDFVERRLNMFSGSFQCNFPPLSMATQPVKGQDEAWSLVVDEKKKAKQCGHVGRKKT